MHSVLLKPPHNSAQQRCFENGNDDFGVEAFWIGDAARVGYFVPLNGPLNGHPPSCYYSSTCHERLPPVRSESGPSWQVAAGYRDINTANTVQCSVLSGTLSV